MAKVHSYKASSYYTPALAVGKYCGLDRKMATAFACRIVDRAANGSAHSWSSMTENGVWLDVKQVYNNVLSVGSDRIACGAKILIPHTVVSFITRTRPATWAAWLARASSQGLI